MGKSADGMGELVRLTCPGRALVIVDRLSAVRTITKLYAWVSEQRRTPFILRRSKVGLIPLFAPDFVLMSCSE